MRDENPFCPHGMRVHCSECVRRPEPRLIQGFAAIGREAGEQMAKRARELRERILAVAPEAKFTLYHDETVIECAVEHQEAVAQVVRAQVLEGIEWSKLPKLPEGPW